MRFFRGVITKVCVLKVAYVCANAHCVRAGNHKFVHQECMDGWSFNKPNDRLCVECLDLMVCEIVPDSRHPAPWPVDVPLEVAE